MKKLLILAAGLALSLRGFSQNEPVKSFPDKQVVRPYRVEVTFTKTVHILFPAAVTYVDLGSTDLIAGKADGAENVVRIKAAVRNFSGETNFSVITADGCFYSFNATYSAEPGQLNIEMEDWLHKDPYSDFANDRMYIRLDELGNETPLVVNRIMHTIYERNAREIRTVGSKHFGVQAWLKGVYIHNDLMFLHTSFRNFTRVPFDIDFIRFRIADKNVAKRTALQETFIKPVRVYNELARIGAKKTVRSVYAFGKITIPDDKVLVMEIYESNGGRHQSFRIENPELVNARFVDELKIK
ncbi:conjugative transposon protein TraN [Alistipes indistinctus]|uniref:Conjugative transposon TraN protein n=1 Tax=Alistipes indistinctus YIT 12060 TaxID=742725 RepID=G5HBA1_9BACT|nr:conjugative transposon protein TraN [Alistipes indistinctus]EHB91867.1 hypothetical protein HMPREF9450_01916 [Alistipes indistinctus YIT 12060]UWN59675.1 conjugative transposon protein TraN [Alistipes indistinctus YIT 12060]